MEEEAEYFDVIMYGTKLDDLYNIYKSKKNRSIAVVDLTSEYGTTYSNVNLHDIKHDFVKNLKENKKYSNTVLIEMLPFFLTKYSNVVKEVDGGIFGENVKYLKITKSFFVNSGFYAFEIPNTKTKLYNSNVFSNTFDGSENDNLIDMYWYAKSLEQKNSELFLKHNMCKGKVFKAIEKHNASDFFINYRFVYPKYGISTMCEYLALNLSLKGVVFCLNKNIEVVKSIEKGVDTSFRYQNSFLNTNKFINTKLPKGKTYIRVILYDGKKFDGNFKVLFEHKEIVFDVLGLNSLSGCCPEDTQLLYFLSYEREVNISDIINFGILEKNILYDIEYVIETNLKLYEKYINEL
ncbi:hypothetical protein EHP00_935 [Ecytonucleospora hepatopenaei]|uniref:Uncharacterized protein n=1 Tax=Ecytonucleospora hepatopenaei TaxID=646526 RepID=A0A1W0E742_9MICR|nr:hypothetical protein EHP00_935 [Ecytonucleospora hepatopenaei]